MWSELPKPIALWDFREVSPLQAQQGDYTLLPMSDAMDFSDVGLYLRRGGWLRVPRASIGDLDIHGRDARLTVVAHVYRMKQPETYDCETIAGVWDESRRQRQYCLFLDLPIWDSANQVGGHVSSHGGPTPGYPYCMDAAIGETPVDWQQWAVVGFTYDGEQACAYLDGKLDMRGDRNPFAYPEGLHDGGVDGADFTVGGVSRSGEPGNFFHGVISALAVFGTALSADEMATLSASWHERDTAVGSLN
ncbi:MAG: LamG-like jellyroll fold domain-containing protein [Chloroflexota bacterium]